MRLSKARTRAKRIKGKRTFEGITKEGLRMLKSKNPSKREKEYLRTAPLQQLKDTLRYNEFMESAIKDIAGKRYRERDNKLLRRVIKMREKSKNPNITQLNKQIAALRKMKSREIKKAVITRDFSKVKDIESQLDSLLAEVSARVLSATIGKSHARWVKGKNPKEFETRLMLGHDWKHGHFKEQALKQGQKVYVITPRFDGWGTVKAKTIHGIHVRMSDTGQTVRVSRRQIFSNVEDMKKVNPKTVKNIRLEKWVEDKLNYFAEELADFHNTNDREQERSMTIAFTNDFAEYARIPKAKARSILTNKMLEVYKRKYGRKRNVNDSFNVYEYTNYYGKKGLAIAGNKVMPARYDKILFNGSFADANRFWKKQITSGNYFNKPKTKRNAPMSASAKKYPVKVEAHRREEPTSHHVRVRRAGQQGLFENEWKRNAKNGAIKPKNARDLHPQLAKSLFERYVKANEKRTGRKLTEEQKERMYSSFKYTPLEEVEAYIESARNGAITKEFKGYSTGASKATLASDFVKTRNGKLDQLGQLEKIIIETKNTKYLPNGEVTGGRIYAFNPRTSFVAAVSRKQLALTGKGVQNLGGRWRKNASVKGKAIPVGRIAQITYIVGKSHIENPENLPRGRRVHYFHQFGEESLARGVRNPKRPLLLIDHEGMPVIAQGNYTVTANGIQD